LAEYHVPVMLEECLNGLNINPDGIYVDVTFGGGGHSKAILSKLSKKGRLVGFDQDEDARLNIPDDKRFVFIDQNFEFLLNHLKYQGLYPVDGVLADLGVSSHQFDVSERGFSFRFDDAPLDMRMSKEQSLTASEILKNYPVEKLTSIFKLYGELPQASRIAKQIISHRQSNKFETSADLKTALGSLAPKFKDYKFWAQIYQALRIEVNRELDVLTKFLYQTKDALKKEGRLVIMSYHSLEDRLVKNFINTGNVEGKTNKDFYGNLIRPFDPLTRQAVTASENELETNSRSRSAKLRIGVRNDN